MAQGYLHHFAGFKAKTYSAGIKAYGKVDPKAIAIMQEDGIDISHQKSKNIDAYKHVDFDYIITVCEDACEKILQVSSPSTVWIHHHFEDPSLVRGTDRAIHDAFEHSRDEIKAFCKEFVKRYLSSHP